MLAEVQFLSATGINEEEKKKEGKRRETALVTWNEPLSVEKRNNNGNRISECLISMMPTS